MTDSRFATLQAVLAAVDADLHIIGSDAEATAVVLRILEQEDAAGVTTPHRIALTDEPLLEQWGLRKALAAAGCEVIDPLTMDASPGEAEAWKQQLATCRMGITSSLGIAEETGSMLLTPREPDQRAVSLLPERHVALLTAEQVVPTVDALMARWVEAGPPTGSAVFVTGPSRTADIEKELVLGVHGPQAVNILLLAP